MLRGDRRNPKAIKDLIILVVASIFVYLLAVLSGGFDEIEKWATRNGLSRIHAEELVTILAILGFACAIFFFRRSRELHAELLGRKQSEQIMRKSRVKSLRNEKEWKRLFRQVEFVKNEWERTLDSVSDMMILSDTEGKIQRCNQAFTNFVGRSYRDILGKSLESLLSEQGIEVRDLKVEMLKAQFQIKGKWFDLKSYPYKDIVSGNITGSVVTIHDRSAHGKEAEVPEIGCGELEVAPISTGHSCC